MPDVRTLRRDRGMLGPFVPGFPLLLRLVLAAAALSLGTAAAADEIRVVTGGDAFASEGDSGFVLIGSGFRFAGEVPPGITAALGQCVIFLCSPGDPVALSADATPHLFDPGPAAFNGQDFGTVFLDGDLRFHAPIVTVPVVARNGLVEVSAPFTFTAMLSGFVSPQLTGAPLFSTRLRGRGAVTLSFTNSAEFGAFADRVSYRFQDAAATPEPASILLIGFGLGGLLARGRRSLHD